MSHVMPRLLLMVMGLMMGCAAIAKAQQGAPPPPTPTLWRFLGIPEGLRKVRGNLVNRRGNFPNLEGRPPLKALADPANLVSENPAIKAAAEIKAAELLAPQKIKALKYLATMGCGCYDKDGKITDALQAAMAGDCTERVRLEAVRAVSDAARGQICHNCNQQCCCNEKILKQLAATAYERDEFGCYVEPSARVRRAAEEALQACCPGGPLEFIPPPEGNREDLERIEDGRPEGIERLPGSGNDEAQQGPAPVVVPTAEAAWRNYSSPVSSLSTFAGFERENVGSYFAETPTESARGEIEGAVTHLHPNGSRATVRFTSQDVLPVGTHLHVYQNGPGGIRAAGTLLIANSRPGEATVIAKPGTKLDSMAAGDIVIGSRGTSLQR